MMTLMIAVRRTRKRKNGCAENEHESWQPTNDHSITNIKRMNLQQSQKKKRQQRMEVMMLLIMAKKTTMIKKNSGAENDHDSRQLTSGHSPRSMTMTMW